MAPETVSIPSLLHTALLRGRRGWTLAACTLGMMTHQLGEVAVPVLIGVIVDQAVVRQDPHALMLWIAVLGLVFLLLSLSYQWAALGMVRTFGHGENDLRQLAISRVLHQRGRSETRGVGEVLAVSTSDTSRVAGVGWSIAQQGATVAALVSACVALLVISVPLGIGVVCGAVCALAAMHWISRPLEAAGQSEQHAAASASEVATDTMLGLRVLRGLDAETEAVRRYREASRASLGSSIAAARRLLTNQTVSSAVSVLYLAGLTLAAAWLALTGSITAGQLVTVVALAQFLQGSLAHLGTFAGNWLHKRASAKRVQRLVTEPYAHGHRGAQVAGVDGLAGVADVADVADVAGAAGAESADSAPPPLLAWRHVGSAGYGGHTTRGEFDGQTRDAAARQRMAEVREGEMVGVRVPNTAAARAIAATLGLRSVPTPGQLFVCGRDAALLSPGEYRSLVVAPPHGGALFTGSLRENICGLADAVAEPLHLRRDLLTATALDEVVDRLGSLDAPIGEQGAYLSGGQRQRVLLARALHAPAKVIVLDEPTTALDPVTEQRVAEGLRTSGRALVVLSTSPILLAACHRIVEPPEISLGLAQERAEGAAQERAEGAAQIRAEGAIREYAEGAAQIRAEGAIRGHAEHPAQHRAPHAATVRTHRAAETERSGRS